MSSRGPRFRRNGKLFACEPCRKQKVRCDHALPVCGRCRKRKAEQECNYHPAPLTRPSAVVTPSDGSPSWGNPPPETPTPPTLPILSTPLDNTFSTAGRSFSVPAGTDTPAYLGSISFSEVFKASTRGHVSDNIWLEPLANVTKSLRSPATYTLPEERIQSGAEILSLLFDFEYINKTIERYCVVSQIVALPWSMLKKSLDSLQSTLRQHPTKAQRYSLSKQIFTQTFIPLQVDEANTGGDFHLTFTGSKLRWEFLGVLFTYIALGSLLDEDHVAGPPRSAKPSYTQDFTRASNLCISFCDRAESLNELLIWLLHGSSILLTFRYGDTSHLAWRRTGDLASSIYAMGLHQDPSTRPHVPFFLAELRRRTWANAYSTDKAESTFFGRPPRLSMRYSSCRLPLDLTDEELIAPAESRDRAIAKLDAAGWNTAGQLSRQSWARIKLLISKLREEVLELSLGPPDRTDAEIREKALDVLARGEQTWASIPRFARYQDSLWNSSLPANQCFTLLYYYLNVKLSEFLLYRILARHGGSSWDGMYKVAQELLTGILVISKQRDRIAGLSRDFSWVSIFYGLPSAAILSIELLRQQQLSDRPHVPLPRAEIIRNVSVFISSLEWVARPDDGNFDLCQGAKLMLEKILDSILDYQPVPSAESLQSAPADPVVWVDELFGGGWMNSGPFLDSLATADPTSWEMPGNWPFEL
ncbi:hypothetical protein EJ08DRAFT_578120 [Tothia fuscella]|uniref:Zn(2)-C6 fungal-type domain-containing protein n=1 Tax=Tothia fuscella TaxID=1048955 RepID=A0A9P4U5H9_9PEZI|nr:hypothetical protein EJ08DRAFT_578120 [Tothia fuscella]